MDTKTNVLKALLSAKQEIGKVAKNAKNPHFKNTYADINALLEAVEPILLDKGLLLIQPINDGKVSTIIIHAESGEQMESSIDLPALSNPQQMGSAITYYRRYTLQSLLSLQAEDDDANTASKTPVKKKFKDFFAAVKSVKDGDITVEEIVATYEVSMEQLAMLNAAKK
jgi:hypothetical protein